MIGEDAPTRAEADLAEMPTGTRRLCEYCGCTSGESELRPCVQVSKREPDEHSFREFPLCSSCGGEGGQVRFTPGSVMPDPQTEELCSRCEGTGVEGLI